MPFTHASADHCWHQLHVVIMQSLGWCSCWWHHGSSISWQRNACMCIPAASVTVPHCMQVAQVASLMELEQMIAAGSPTNDLGGHQIRLQDPTSAPPEGCKPVTFRVNHNPNVDVEGRCGVSVVIADDPDLRCWTLKQATGTLQNAVIHIPQNGRLIVCADNGRWQNVHIHGVPSTAVSS